MTPVPLYGLQRPDSKPPGGVEWVALIAVPDIRGVSYDADSDCFVVSGELPTFVKHEFREDKATYHEETVCGRGQPTIKHTLTMEFTASRRSRRAMEQLAARTDEGFVAVVGTMAGERLLAGYSLRFGAAYPLRTFAVDSDTAGRRPDYPFEKLVLVSEDTERSKPLAG